METVMEDYLRSNDYILPLYKKEIDAFVAGGGERPIIQKENKMTTKSNPNANDTAVEVTAHN